MKNEGVTLLQLVIAIVIMLILATVAVYYTQNISAEARIASVYNEIKEVKSTMNEAKLLDKIEVDDRANPTKLILFGGEFTVNKVDNDKYTKQLSNDSTGNYYYLDFTSSRKLENVLELENVNNDYLFDFDNMHVYIVKGVTFTSKEEGSTLDKLEIKYKDDDIIEYYDNVFRRK